MNMEIGAKRQKIHDNAEKLRAEGGTHLLSDLGSILDNPESSDVIFVCKDGEKVHAVRWLLSLRCPVFRAMFSHDMAEGKASEIPLPQFTSSIMRCIFEYMYTGSTKSHPINSWKMGFEFISASHFFNIPVVEVAAQDFLWSQTSKIWKDADLGLITNMLLEASEFHETWEGRDTMLQELTDYLGNSWFQGKDDFHKVSEDTMDYVLAMLKRNRPGEADKHVLNEYNSFRQIVMWQVCQKHSPPSTETLLKLRKALPNETDDPLLWSTIFESPLDKDEYAQISSNASDSHDPTIVLRSLLGIDTSKESLQRLLQHIDWCRIPAMLLLKVVWPLGVISPDVLLKAVGIQALCLPVKTWVYRSFDWKHSKDLTSDSTTITCKSRDELRSLSGSAIASLPMARVHETYELQFEIQQNDATFISLGLICGSDSHPWNEHDFEDGRLLQCNKKVLVCTVKSGHGRISVCTKKLNTTVWRNWTERTYELSRKFLVTFTLDMSKNKCQISCDGLSVLWKSFPTAVYYPVVEFTNGRFARIKLKTSKGFHCLSCSQCSRFCGDLRSKTPQTYKSW